jgi:hypothetical protein
MVAFWSVIAGCLVIVFGGPKAIARALLTAVLWVRRG